MNDELFRATYATERAVYEIEGKEGARGTFAWRIRSRKFKCWHCGEIFEAKRRDARYCSRKCRQAAWRARR